MIASGGEIWANEDGPIVADGGVTMSVKDGKTTMTTNDGWRYESSSRSVWTIYHANGVVTDRSLNYNYEFIVP